MQKLKFICLGSVTARCIAMVMFAWRPNANIQVISMAMLAGLFVLTIVAGIIAILSFKHEKFRAVLPMGICVVGLFVNLLVAPSIGGLMRVWSFHRRLPDYREVVRLVEKGEIKADASFTKIELPAAHANLAVITRAKTNAAGEICVEFIIGGGFPVKHSGYLYMSAGNIESDPDTLRRWPRHRKLEDKWFAVGD